MDEFKAEVYARADAARQKRAERKIKLRIAFSGVIACFAVFAAVYAGMSTRASVGTTGYYGKSTLEYSRECSDVKSGEADGRTECATDEGSVEADGETEAVPCGTENETFADDETTPVQTTTAQTATAQTTAVQTTAAQTTTVASGEPVQVSVTAVIGGNVKTAFVRTDPAKGATSEVEKNVDGGTVFLDESAGVEYAVATVKRIDGAVSATFELLTEDGEDKATVVYGFGECESDISGWIIIFYRQPGDHETVTMFAD